MTVKPRDSLTDSPRRGPPTKDGIMQSQKDNNPSSQGGQDGPFRTNRRDLGGLPHRTDTNTQLGNNGRGSPVESPPVTSSTAFQSCGHGIRGNLRNYSSSGPTECHTCKTNPPSALGGRALARGEQWQRTLADHHDPTKVEGVTSEIITRDSGRQSYKIEPDVWKTMSKKARRNFTYNNNIKFGLPPGPSPRPTNPGNPNHPDYNPHSRASLVRSSLAGGRDAKKVVNQQPTEANAGPAAKQASFAGTQSATPILSQANVAGTGTGPAVSVSGQAHVTSSQSPTCPPGGAKKKLLDLLESIRNDNNHIAKQDSASSQASVQANVAGTELPIATPNMSPVSASNRGNAAGIEFAACAPSETVARPTTGESASGDAAWDPRLFPGWVGYPDFRTYPVEYPCILWSCAVKSTTPAELIVHILLSHK